MLRVDAARARTMIETLPPDQRSAIELAFFGGLTIGRSPRTDAAARNREDADSGPGCARCAPR